MLTGGSRREDRDGIGWRRETPANHRSGAEGRGDYAGRLGSVQT